MERDTDKIENLKDKEFVERADSRLSDVSHSVRSGSRSDARTDAHQSARYIKDPSRQQPRLFLAIDLSAEIKDAIESATRGMDLTHGKRPAKQNLHITMLFLGTQDSSVIKLMMDELPKRLSTCKPFSAEMTGLGAFPSPTRPRVLWLGVGRGSDQMMDISGKLGDLAEALGIASRDARFHPHVTLARLKTPTDLSSLIASNAPKLKGLKPFEFKVTYISIFESILSAAGPRYEELGRVYL